MSKSAAALIAAMRAASLYTVRGAIAVPQAKGAAEWLTAAQTNEEMRAALAKIFGKKLPTAAKLGRWLHEHSGKSYGEHRLVAVWSAHKGSFNYAVETAAETDARELEDLNQEERREIIGVDKELRSLGRLLKRSEEEAEKKRDAVELAKIQEGLSITVAPARKLKCGPDGRPVPADPELPPPASRPLKPAEPERPMTRVEEWRARYVAHHQPKRDEVENLLAPTPAGAGFANPGGVVSFNISREGGLDVRTSRLRLRDF